MEEESDGSETLDVPESDALEPDAPESDIVEPDVVEPEAQQAGVVESHVVEPDADADSWDSEGSEGAGWFADPEVEGQERYFDGSEWTSETRSAASDAPVHHLPDHAGELQRALAAATNDIDDVEDRLGNLFDRAEQHGERGGRAREQVAAAGQARRVAEGQAIADSVDQDDPDAAWEAGFDGDAEAGDSDDALFDLDEALAHEEPEKVKKTFFRRRS